MYAAAVLSKASADLLKGFVIGHSELDSYEFETGNGDPLPHHMTINLGAFDTSLNDASLLGCQAVLIINEIVYDDTLGVCAAPVIASQAKLNPVGPRHLWKAIKTINQHAHITCCIKPGSKPKFSNSMLTMLGPNTKIIGLDKCYELEAIICNC